MNAISGAGRAGPWSGVRVQSRRDRIRAPATRAPRINPRTRLGPPSAGRKSPSRDSRPKKIERKRKGKGGARYQRKMRGLAAEKTTKYTQGKAKPAAAPAPGDFFSAERIPRTERK